MTLALILVIVSWLHPGAEVTHRPFLEAVAAQAPSDEVAVDMVVWAHKESGFGLRTRGDGGRSWGILQLWGRKDIEHDEVAQVGAWLKIRAAAENKCGEPLALAGLSSGHCDRGLDLAERRHTTALWWLGMATLALRSGG